LPVGEIGSALGKTELAKFGDSVRYRPSYYFIRTLEASAWGKNVTAWYAARLAISLFVVLSLALFCWHVLGRAPAFVYILYEFSQEYWFTLFGQLGPAETYTAGYGHDRPVLCLMSKQK
jgi:hypothetical protein